VHTQRWLRAALAALTGLLLALIVFRPQGDDTTGGSQTLVDPAPPLELTSHEGERVRLDAFTGRVVAIFFGYTHCPDVCPLGIAHLTRTLERVDPDGDDLKVLFVTVDPERDTEARLARYLASFHPSIIGLTGERADVEAQARAFGVGILVPDHEPGEAYLVDHTARIFLIDRMGHIAARVPATAGAEELIREVTPLLEAGGSRGR
jgi:protein SCO1/2